MIDQVSFTTGPAAGAAGSAAGEGWSQAVNGRVLGVRVELSGATAGTRLALRDEHQEGENIVFLTGSAGRHIYPRRVVSYATGGDATFNGSEGVCEPFAVNGRLLGQLSLTNPGAWARITVWFER